MSERSSSLLEHRASWEFSGRAIARLRGTPRGRSCGWSRGGLALDRRSKPRVIVECSSRTECNELPIWKIPGEQPRGADTTHSRLLLCPYDQALSPIRIGVS